VRVDSDARERRLLRSPLSASSSPADGASAAGSLALATAIATRASAGSSSVAALHILLAHEPRFLGACLCSSLGLGALDTRLLIALVLSLVVDHAALASIAGVWGDGSTTPAATETGAAWSVARPRPEKLNVERGVRRGVQEVPALVRQPGHDGDVGQDEEHEHEQHPRREPPGFATRSTQHPPCLAGHRSKSAVIEEEPTLASVAIAAAGRGRLKIERTP
jgi:hypothetical protein